MMYSKVSSISLSLLLPYNLGESNIFLYEFVSMYVDFARFLFNDISSITLSSKFICLLISFGDEDLEHEEEFFSEW